MAKELAKNIYVTVPVETANKAANMARITKEVLGKLGCLGCHSGFNIRFILDGGEMFKFNEKFDIKGTRF